jgi:hypothetical protein
VKRRSEKRKDKMETRRFGWGGIQLRPKCESQEIQIPTILLCYSLDGVKCCEYNVVIDQVAKQHI